MTDAALQTYKFELLRDESEEAQEFLRELAVSYLFLAPTRQQKYTGLMSFSVHCTKAVSRKIAQRFDCFVDADDSDEADGLARMHNLTKKKHHNDSGYQLVI